MQPGDKCKAELKECSVGMDKNNVPLILLKIKVYGEGNEEKIIYKNLSFAGGAKKYSLITLAVIGFHGEKLSDLSDPMSFQPVDFEVVLEMQPDGKGGERLGIKYINDPDVPIKGGLSKEEIIKNGDMDIAKEFKALGIHPRLVGSANHIDDIPFGE